MSMSAGPQQPWPATAAARPPSAPSPHPGPRDLTDAVVCDHWAALRRRAEHDPDLSARLDAPSASVQDRVAGAAAHRRRTAERLLAGVRDAGGLLIAGGDIAGDAGWVGRRVAAARRDGRPVAVDVSGAASAVPVTVAAAAAGATVVVGAQLPSPDPVRLSGGMLLAGLPVLTAAGAPTDSGRTPALWPVADLSDPHLSAARLVWRSWTGRWRAAHDLALWVRALRAVGLTVPSWGAVIGGHDGGVVWYPLADRRYRYPGSGGRARLDADMLRAATATAYRTAVSQPTRPARRPACDGCPAWQQICGPQLAGDDDVSLVAGAAGTRQVRLRAAGVTRRADLARLHHLTAAALAAEPDLPELIGAARTGPHLPDEPLGVLWRRDRPARRRALADLGVRTVADVARLDSATAAVAVAGPPPARLPDLIDQARVQVAGQVRLARTVAEGTVDLGFGSGDPTGRPTAPPRGALELHTDMENDGPLLIGIGSTVRTSAATLRHFGGHRWFSLFDYPDRDPQQASARLFADFWSWQARLLAAATSAGLTARHLVYSGAERRAFVDQADRAAAYRQGTPDPAEVEAAFAAGWVDLHGLLTRQLLWPSGSTRLKDLAGQVAGYRWRDRDPSGASCVVWFRHARLARTVGDTATFTRLARRIADYNADDCAGQAHLVGWLHRRLSGDGPPLRPVSDFDTDPRFRPAGRTAVLQQT